MQNNQMIVKNLVSEGADDAATVVRSFELVYL